MKTKKPEKSSDASSDAKALDDKKAMGDKKEEVKEIKHETKDDSLTPKEKEEVKEIVEETIEEELEEKDEEIEEKSEAATSNVAVETAEKEEVLDKDLEEKKDDTDAVASIENSPKIDLSKEPEKSDAVLGDTPVGGPTGDSPDPSTEASIPVVSTLGTTPEEVSVGTMASQGASASAPKKEKKSSLLMLFIVFLICGFIIGVTGLYLSSRGMLKIPGMTLLVKPTPTPIVRSTPTPVPAEIGSYKISVLNGSGVGGAAAKAKQTLTDAGFSVASTGNSEKSVTQTTIAAKSSVDQSAIAKLTETLAKGYTVSSNILPLESSESADIVVTVGPAK